MKKGFGISFFALTCSLFVHAYLSFEHVALKFGASTGANLCNINQVFSCDVVGASAYANWFGIPTAAFGFTANLVALFLLVVRKLEWTEDLEATEAFSFALSLVIASTSIVMGSISLGVLGAVCTFCMAAYVFSFANLLGQYLLGYHKSISHLSSMFSTSKWLLGSLAFIPILAYLGGHILGSKYGADEVQNSLHSSISLWTQNPVYIFQPQLGLRSTHAKSASAQTDDPTKSSSVRSRSDSKSRVEIVEFIDLLCIHCKHASPSLDAFVGAHSDTELLVKFFVLDGTCNPAIPSKGDGLRCDLAKFVLCAESEESKGFLAKRIVFERQEEFYVPSNNRISTLEALNKDIQGNWKKISACMNRPEIQDQIMKMGEEGKAANVSGTPAIFVGGRELRGGMFLPLLESARNNLLGKK